MLPGAMPVVAASDYVRALPAMIAPQIRARFVTLGTDGFGRSDQRHVLRDFFEVDRHHVALAAIEALVRDGLAGAAVLTGALESFGKGAPGAAPWTL